MHGSVRVLQPFLTMLLIGVATGSGVAMVGVALSWTVVRTDIPRPGLWEKILILPLYLSPLMLALAFMALAAPRTGFVNILWQQLPWGGDLVSIYSYVGVIFVLIVPYVPYALLLLAAPMSSEDR